MHLIPWRVIFFFVLPAVLILWKVLPWAHGKGWGFITKSGISTVIMGCCFTAAPFSLVAMDKLAIWLLSDSTESGDAQKVAYMQRLIPRDTDYAMSLNYAYVWQMALLVGVVLVLVYMAHLALKKRGKSWTNL